MISQSLIETREGICLSSPIGKSIWQGDTSLIIRPKLYRNQVNKLLYLLEGDQCYGIIKLKHPENINVSEFNNKEKEHNLSSDDRKRWWPYKEVLFSYQFDKVSMFKEPRKIKVNGIPRTFIDDFDFLDIEENICKDLESYNPANVENNQLIEDWKFSLAWYSTKLSGGKVKHSIEQLTKLTKSIYQELKKRNELGIIDFQPKKVNELSENKVTKLSFTPMKPKKKFYELEEAVNIY